MSGDYAILLALAIGASICSLLIAVTFLLVGAETHKFRKKADFMGYKEHIQIGEKFILEDGVLLDEDGAKVEVDYAEGVEHEPDAEGGETEVGKAEEDNPLT